MDLIIGRDAEAMIEFAFFLVGCLGTDPVCEREILVVTVGDVLLQPSVETFSQQDKPHLTAVQKPQRASFNAKFRTER